MMKIAFISEHASPLAQPGSIDCGGQNVYVAHLAQQLAQLGFAVDIFTRRENLWQKQIVRWKPNVRVIHVPAGPARYIPKENILPYMKEFAEFMIGFLRRDKTGYDLLHANFFMSGWVAQQVKRTLGLPFVITFHALGLIRRLLQGPADGFPPERIVIEQHLMHHADRIIAECMQDRLDMERHYQADRRHIDIVPCGFDPDELRPDREQARQRLGLGSQEFVILQLGRIVPRKGIDNVIESLAILRERHGIDARLLVVGGHMPEDNAPDSAEMARLMALSTALGLTDRIRFTGQKARHELADYYSAADVFVTTPWYEPFGITPLEAMACATPVVGAAVGGIKSTVQEGVTGYLVPPKNPEALADRLALLHTQPDHARALGEAGQQRVHRFYTWRSVAETMAGIYEQVADAAPAVHAQSTRSNLALQPSHPR
ncbi:HAD family hydrolase [Novimethylophilus kurashikiensis]|uniref:HAD family hydrolase n=1 Tax=Novimethylophilus kurashikiensis TaxID=1825523 RepID=A0A2R5F1N7_9PROT|nr:glycosyltransferase family 1 protein [Novimethylophilus kurashikiensis]GBG12607.1 HAD family hydrolase [Novimethylophilus kurashikiensis]